ncbi:hypothetical protein [Tunturiibacter lichenicola]|uniref:hypothetical protein n=1 Tax=Tunturiibacter lichenicola TaxID=2051959 RepID=UPI003D9AC447
MASSISNSSEIAHDTGHEALPSGLRLTAADRPGVAQPVPERDIPDQPWRMMSAVVLVLVILLTCLWEWKIRALELVRGDFSESYDAWAELRRQVDKRDVRVVIISDSRLLFDTDLDRAEQLIGVRPLQLGIAGGKRIANPGGPGRRHSLQGPGNRGNDRNRVLRYRVFRYAAKNGA